MTINNQLRKIAINYYKNSPHRFEDYVKTLVGVTNEDAKDAILDLYLLGRRLYEKV